MGKKILESSEICSIIKACGESEVSELKFGDLSIKFGRSASHLNPEPVLDRSIEQEQTRIQDEVLVQDELMSREDELANMLVEDPVRYEEMLAEMGEDIVEDNG